MNGSFIGVPKTRKRIEHKLQQTTVAARMSWAANRQTTRVEDQAYCLLGLFDISMPMLYGEGKKAFWRLRQEIMKTSDDATILAWGYGIPPDRDAYMEMNLRYAAHNSEWYCQHLCEQARKTRIRSLLATSPEDFRFAGALKRYNGPDDLSLDFGISQRGLMLDGVFVLNTDHSLHYLVLPCTDANDYILAMPMVSLPALSFSESDRDRCLATVLCTPIPIARSNDKLNCYRLYTNNKRCKYYLHGSFANFVPPSIPDQFFDKRTFLLRFVIHPPWPISKAPEFRLETVYPALSRQPVRFGVLTIVRDISIHDFKLTTYHIATTKSWINPTYHPWRSQVFIFNINGKRILLAFGTSSHQDSTHPVCYAATLGVEALMRPTLVELSSILAYPYKHARMIPIRSPDPEASEPSYMFHLSPGLVLCAKHIGPNHYRVTQLPSTFINSFGCGAIIGIYGEVRGISETWWCGNCSLVMTFDEDEIRQSLAWSGANTVRYNLVFFSF